MKFEKAEKARPWWRSMFGGDTSAPADLPQGPHLLRFSNLASTALRRHLQSLHERGDRRNPDVLAGELLTEADRDAVAALSAGAVESLRRAPYYYYLVARTKAYDQLLLEALIHGLRRVILIGSGFDTRFYRYGGLLAKFEVQLVEVDQPAAIEDKRRYSAGLPYASRVEYLGVDLNDADSRGALLQWILRDSTPVFALGEGVSPYVETSSFNAFLTELAATLPAGSRFAYDIKRTGHDEAFGRTEAVENPYRLPDDDEVILEAHRSRGFKQVRVEQPRAMMKMHIPSWNDQVSPLFEQDALLVVDL